VGLREKKAQRNRERIVSEGLALFGRNGYEQTTMEAIAERAEVSPSTLYRYFPSKDTIVLQRFTDFSEQFAKVFAEYSLDHPVDEALAEAIFAVLNVEDSRAAETLLVRRIIDESPIARARLWDYLAEQQRQLGKLLARRLRAKESDLRVIFTAQLAIMIAGMAADRWRANGGKPASRTTAEELMRLLEEGAMVFPRLVRKKVRAGEMARRKIPQGVKPLVD
jgi:AcrR family transcriptional regulator